MTIKLTPASFLTGLRQSGLLDARQFDAALADLERDGVDHEDAAVLANALVRRGVVTEWQAEKLLQGRHKGFMLGRYKLLSLLGAGEMSAVYLAEHTLLERQCAIKVLPGNRVKDTSYLARFHREAKAVASLNHPNIVRAYDVDRQVEGGIDIHFLVMEYVEGRNLEKIVSMKGPLRYVDAAEFVRQAAEGLNHAHQAGLVHRDIKPENLLIDAGGTVKILDLGLARLFEQTDEESLTIKHDEKVLGTADYLAPEQAIDSHKVDARADIYSLGCTLYFALTGHPPFTEGTLVQRLFAHQTKSPTPVSQERADAPEGLMLILDKMIAKKSADRYQSAAELSLALTRWLAENGGRAWRTRHVGLVANLYGLEALSQPSATPSKLAATPAAASVSGKVSGPAVKSFSTPEQPEIYTTSKLGSGAGAGSDQTPASSEVVTSQKNMSVGSKVAPKRVTTIKSNPAIPVKRAATSSPQRRTPAASRSNSAEVQTTEIKQGRKSETRSITALSDTQRQRTLWMIAWVGMTIFTVVCVSTLLMWFFRGSFPTTKPVTTFNPAEMVIGS